MHMEDFRKYRFMPFVKRGMRVKNTHNGRSGRIAGANPSFNLNIIFDGDKHPLICHPYFKMQNLGKNGELIKIYKW